MERARRVHLIRDKLDRGLLPVYPIPRFWGRAGKGELCSACEEPVGPFEPLIEGTGDEDAGARPWAAESLYHGASIQFHIECFFLWARARRHVPSGVCPGWPPGSTEVMEDAAAHIFL